MFGSADNLEAKVWDDAEIELGLIPYITELKSPTILVCSVREVPPALHQVLGSFQTTFLDHSTPVPIEINYDSPETLGLDRLALAVAACSQYSKKNTLIIDAGTCITYDVILDGKRYIGGGISPGIEMRYRALNHFTGKLPHISATNQEKVSLGKSTSSSIQFGVFRGAIAEIDGIIDRLVSEHQIDSVVLTGGNAKELANHLKNNIFADPYLLLKGLDTILKYQDN